MFSVSISVLFLVHLMACLWYLTAKIEDFSPDTWVVRDNINNASNIELYITSIYWTFTTLTTVGYGDITPYTIIEKLLALCWMVFGVGFYSFTIGNL